MKKIFTNSRRDGSWAISLFGFTLFYQYQAIPSEDIKRGFGLYFFNWHIFG